MHQVSIHIAVSFFRSFFRMCSIWERKQNVSLRLESMAIDYEDYIEYGNSHEIDRLAVTHTHMHACIHVEICRLFHSSSLVRNSFKD